MSATEEMPGVDMSFLSTHPSSKNRTVQVRKWADDVSWEQIGRDWHKAFAVRES